MSGPEKTEDIDHKQNPELDYQCKSVFLDYVDVLTKTDILFEAIDKNTQINSKEDEVYFYHGDHLGSANWITDIKGDAIQYMHYAPYGEMVDNQQASAYNERFKFTGKERDEETGYDYFGARYWWLAGTWLSVDPWTDKYPGISPYSYCMWNPITNQDPNGCGDPLTVMKVRRMKINNTFGMVRCYPDGSPKNHQGIDYYAPVGTDIMAVKDGIVVGCDLEGKGDYGKTITLQFEGENGKKAWAFYSHLSEIDVNVNDQVKEGDVIGKTGISGNANNLKGEDQHLHFEYRTGGARLGKGLNGRDDPNLIVDTKFEPDPNNKGKVRYKED